MAERTVVRRLVHEALHLEVGEEIDGTYKGQKEVVTRFGKATLVQVVRGSDGAAVGLWANGILLELLDGIVEGAPVVIKRVRDRPPRRDGDSAMKMYEVATFLSE